MKPSPRSHRRSLARSDRIGERRWRRGRASIPLVNLSERISSGIDCDPWLVVTASRKHGPGDARELVGERDRQQIAMREALGGSFDPRPQSPHRCGRPPYQDDVGGLNEQRPEVSCCRAWRSCRAWCDRRSTPASAPDRARRQNRGPDGSRRHCRSPPPRRWR